MGLLERYKWLFGGVGTSISATSISPDMSLGSKVSRNSESLPFCRSFELIRLAAVESSFKSGSLQDRETGKFIICFLSPLGIFVPFEPSITQSKKEVVLRIE